MEVKCSFWSICGAAIIRQYRAGQSFSYSCGDPQGDYTATVCSDEGRCSECEHYKIRAAVKRARKKRGGWYAQNVLRPSL